MPIYALGDVEPSIDATAYIHPDAIVIGDVTIGAESSVWPTAVLRGDPGGIVIGAGTSIQDGTVVHTTPATPTLVGDECVIGHLVHLEGCTIGNGSLVGSGAIVLNGAVLEDECLVGAGALVPGNLTVPRHAMALGVPATIKHDAVKPELHIQPGMAIYRERGNTYRQRLRRLD
jgi:carbonic anhydrase/acetyltransferase-like protein (isoleucine patch superfamily)